MQVLSYRPVCFEVSSGFSVNGESGIRTHGDISATLDFESSALDQLSHLSGCRDNKSRRGIMMA